MKNLDLDLKLSLPCNAYDTNDVSNATPNNFDSESVQPTFDCISPRAIIPQNTWLKIQGGTGSSGGVNQQYGYGAPTFAGTTVVGVPAAAVYMNQMEMMNNEPVLELAPPNIPEEVGESIGSNATSTSVALALPIIPAAQSNFFNDIMFHQNKRCLLCNTCKTPMWRRGPLGTNVCYRSFTYLSPYSVIPIYDTCVFVFSVSYIFMIL
ncbi:hypothetical protein LINGRAHAP2_LOCUS20238 [Linum grandiflorum]